MSGTTITAAGGLSTESATLSTSEADMIDIVVADHHKQHKYKHKEGCGGIMPCAVDPTSGKSYFLFGLNRANHYCHFHGWVDPKETLSFGCAREGWEEAAGAYASLLDLWRAGTDSDLLRDSLCATGTADSGGGSPPPMVSTGRVTESGGGGNSCSSRYYYPFNDTMKVMVLGPRTEEERLAICQQFHVNPKFYGCMDEVKCLDWVDAISLRDACRLFAGDDIRGYGLFQQQRRAKQQTSAVVGNSDFAVNGFKAGCTLRGFLQDWLASPDTVQSGWDSIAMKTLVDEGRLIQGWLPLSQLPRLSEAGTRAFCLALGIPFCNQCKTEGHFTLMCEMAKETEVAYQRLKMAAKQQHHQQQGNNPTRLSSSLFDDDTFARLLPRRRGLLYFAPETKKSPPMTASQTATPSTAGFEGAVATDPTPTSIMVMVDDSPYSGLGIMVHKSEVRDWIKLLPADAWEATAAASSSATSGGGGLGSFTIPVTYHPVMRSLHTLIARYVRFDTAAAKN